MKTLNWCGLIALCVQRQNVEVLLRLENYAAWGSFDEDGFQVAVFNTLLQELGVRG